MFGNRKRKLQDDEESLVPHGMVWHATAEPTPAEVAKNEETLGYTVNYAQEIERVRREQSTQLVEHGAEVASQAPAARPEVIPWWRVERAEAPVERPVSKLAPMPLSAYVPSPIEPAVELPRPSQLQPMQIRPTPVQPVDLQPIPAAPVAPIQATSMTAIPAASPTQILRPSAPTVEGSMALAAQVQASPISESVRHDLPTPSPQVEERLVPKSSEIIDALVLAFSRTRAIGQAVGLSLARISGKVIERGRQTAQSLELGKGLNRAGKQSRNLMRSGIVKTSQYARRTGSALGSFSRAGISRVQQISTRVGIASATSSEDVMPPATPLPSSPSRVRLGLTASALQVRIFVSQQLSAWELRRERMAVDSRFWASMTLAAIAAIIALVIVSLVPHYAAKSLPSRLLNTNPSVDANVAAPVAAAATPVPAAATPASKATVPVPKAPAAESTQTTLSKTASAKTDSSKSAANAKPKRAVYDDYVAPNTYKYYGTGSKSSR